LDKGAGRKGNEADDEGEDSEAEIEEQEQEIQLLREQVEQARKARERDEAVQKKLARDRRREAIALERAALLESLNGSGASLSKQESSVRPKHVKSTSRLKSSLPPESLDRINDHQSQSRSRVRGVHDQLSPRGAGKPGLTIDGIRALPGLAQYVETLVEGELAKVPSLAHPPQAGVGLSNPRQVVIDGSDVDCEEEYLGG